LRIKAELECTVEGRVGRFILDQDCPLAIAKEIMQAHGGEISITSEITKGTKVRLLFPVSRKWGAN